MTNIPQHWVEKAEYDLSAAKAMLDSRHYLYVLFCCQQAIEKLLKAIIAKQTDELPPRLHNLIRLTELADLDLTEKQLEFLRKLSEYYIKSRYPEIIRKISDTVNLQIAKKNYNKTREIYKCLLNIL